MRRLWLWISRHGVGVVVAVCALAASIALVVTAPGDRRTQAPFVVTGAIGDTVTGRDISARVHGVTETRTLISDNAVHSFPVHTSGVWVLVDAAVASMRAPSGGLQYAKLRVGADTYDASRRLGSNVGLLGVDLTPGVFRRGWLAFEVPATAARQGHAEVRLARSTDVRLDSEIAISVALDHARQVASSTIGPPVIR